MARVVSVNVGSPREIGKVLKEGQVQAGDQIKLSRMKGAETISELVPAVKRSE